MREHRLWLREQNMELKRVEAERVRLAWDSLVRGVSFSTLHVRQRALAILADDYIRRAQDLQETPSPELRSWSKRCEGLAFRLLAQIDPNARNARITLRRDPGIVALVRARNHFLASSNVDEQQFAWQKLSNAFRIASPALRRYASELEQMTQKWGSTDFLTSALAARGLSKQQVEEWFLSFLTENNSLADADHPWENLHPLGVNQIAPNCRYPEEKTVVSTLEGLGFQRSSIDAIPLVKLSKAKKVPWALCFAIDPPSDVRIVTTNGTGFNYVTALLHEFGHALYFSNISAEDLADLQEPPQFVEGVAFAFELLAFSVDWLTEYTDLYDSAEKASTQLWRLYLNDLRWVILEALFELYLFDSLSVDAYELWSQLAYHLEFAVPGIGAGHSLLATDETARPLRYLDYALGRLIGLHSFSNLSKAFSKIEKAEALRTIYFHGGAFVPWIDKVRAFTGEWPPLSVSNAVGLSFTPHNKTFGHSVGKWSNNDCRGQTHQEREQTTA